MKVFVFSIVRIYIDLTHYELQYVLKEDAADLFLWLNQNEIG